MSIMPSNSLKNKYVRSIIKLGNSKAITFPQEWTNQANLEEKSEVTLYPVDEKTIVVRAFDKEKESTKYSLDPSKWPFKLIRQAIISAFKLNVDEIHVKYKDNNQEKLYELLIELRREIIGLDFKENDGFFIINFLLDSRKTDVHEVVSDLANVFKSIIIKAIEGTLKKNDAILLAEVDRKYSLGTRILITGLSEFPISKGYKNLPIIRFLGDRVILLYIRDFINETYFLREASSDLITKYSGILKKIPQLLIRVIKEYANINIEVISEFQEYLHQLNADLQSIKHDDASPEEQQFRNLIAYYLNSYRNFLDIGITRLIESEIGMT